MKNNEQTSMEPRLQEAIQEILREMNTARNLHTKTVFRARLNGIITAIRALKDEEWFICTRSGRFVLVNEDDTECITEA